jgi:hypothetical protein
VRRGRERRLAIIAMVVVLAMMAAFVIAALGSNTH